MRTETTCYPLLPIPPPNAPLTSSAAADTCAPRTPCMPSGPWSSHSPAPAAVAKASAVTASNNTPALPAVRTDTVDGGGWATEVG